MNKKLILPTIALSACFLASCGGGSKHKINFAGNNYKIKNQAAKDCVIELNKGAKIGVISDIKADAGYALPDSITIDAFSSGYTWNKANGSIDFKDLTMPDKNITITISVTPIHNNRKLTFVGDGYTVVGHSSREITIGVGSKIGKYSLKVTEYGSVFDEVFEITPATAISEYPTFKIGYDESTATIDFKNVVMPDIDFSVRLYVY